MNDDSRSGVVYVVDDDEAVRKGLRRQLGSAGYAVEAFDSAEEFLAHTPVDAPSCIILDVKMKGLDGPALQSHLVEAGSDLPIVFLSGHADVPTSVRAMKRGAVDFLQKPVDDSELLQAVDAALAKSRGARQELKEVSGINHRLELLTSRERDVLEQVLTGALNKQIAGILDIAEQTVKLHRAQVMRKLEVDSVADLVRLCARAGISPPSR